MHTTTNAIETAQAEIHRLRLIPGLIRQELQLLESQCQEKIDLGPLGDAKGYLEAKALLASAIEEEQLHAEDNDRHSASHGIDCYLRKNAPEICLQLRADLEVRRKPEKGLVARLAEAASNATRELLSSNDPETSRKARERREQAEQEAEDLREMIASAERHVRTFEVQPDLLRFEDAVSAVKAVNF